VSKRWLIADSITEEIQKMFPDMDRVILQLLWNRGHKTQEAIDIYLNPDWDRDTYSPSLFTQMPQAVARLFEAFEQGQVITVHGDYDADGVCGSAVLLTTLREIARACGFDETKITSYIPHREKEGYGLSLSTVEHLSFEFHTKLIITVDCGISNKLAIDRAKELGIDTIVCDHHAIPQDLPESAFLIHPLVPGEVFPNKQLCGTGVAFKFASALFEEARKRGASLAIGQEKWLLDLVAIATVTDVMPLTAENRVLEKFGLVVLNKTRRIGIQKLLEVAGATMGELDTVSVGFQIGPRINAAGRMTHAKQALELLIEEDETHATQLALKLHEINVERQKASQAMYVEAKAQLNDVQGQSLLVVVQEGWGAGLLGLVAGKLLNEHYIPVFVVGKEGDHYVGSGRSIEGFDITQALHQASAFLDKFGGHPQACGFSVTSEERFIKAIEIIKAFAAQQIQPEMLEPSLLVDREILFEDIGWDLINNLERFAPYGTGNPIPLFVSRNVKVVSFSGVGKEGTHLKLRLQSNFGKIMEAIGFHLGDWTQRLSFGCLLDVVYELQINEWNGRREIQLRLIDLKKTEET